jgi:hypothetical protein
MDHGVAHAHDDVVVAGEVVGERPDAADAAHGDAG